MSPSSSFDLPLLTDTSSSFDDSSLEELTPSSEEDTYSSPPNANASMLRGLGIFGLTKPNGTPFDGTGSVGLARSVTMRRGGRNDEDEDEDDVFIDSATTARPVPPAHSSPSLNNSRRTRTHTRGHLHRHPRPRPRQYDSAMRSFTHPAESTPIPTADASSAQSVDFEYFPSTSVLPALLGLGIFNLTQGDVELSDGLGIMELQESVARMDLERFYGRRDDDDDDDDDEDSSFDGDEPVAHALILSSAAVVNHLSSVV